MKPMIKKNLYEESLKPIIYRQSIALLVTLWGIVFLYLIVSFSINNDTGNIFSFKHLTDTFFNGLLIWGIIYVVKKHFLLKIIEKAYSNCDESSEIEFLPCIVNTKIFNSSPMNIYIDDNKVYLKKSHESTKVEAFSISIDQLEVNCINESRNYLLKMIWGSTKVIELKNTETLETKSFLVPDVNEVMCWIKSKIKL